MGVEGLLLVAEALELAIETTEFDLSCPSPGRLKAPREGGREDEAEPASK
jgi:hypothetical protein